MRQDILLDANNQIQIVNGDLFIGQSDNQNVDQILTAYPGWFKNNPKCGVGIANMILGTLDADLKSKISNQLANDNYIVVSTSLNTDGSINIKFK